MSSFAIRAGATTLDVPARVPVPRRSYSLVVCLDEALGGTLLEFAQRYTIGLRARTREQAMAMLPRRTDWAAVLLDLDDAQAEPLALIRELRAVDALVPILGFTRHVDAALVNGVHALRAELVSKPVPTENVLCFLRRALVSGFMPDARLAAWVDQVARSSGLSGREVQLLAYVLGSESREGIIRRLGITENTLKTQVRSLLRKCGARNMDRLAFRALREVLLGESRERLEPFEPSAYGAASAE